MSLLVLMPLAVRRLTRIAARHRPVSLRAATSLAVVWVLATVLGVHLEQVAPFASTNTAEYAYAEVSRIPVELRDQREFARAATEDPMREVPGDRLLTRLRGKDVMFVFVESYGRSAVQGSSFSPGVDAVLDDGTSRLRDARVRLTERVPHLADVRGDQLAGPRHAPVRAVGRQPAALRRADDQRAAHAQPLFERAGWRTVGDSPANTHDWPQGAFYGFDQLYDSRNVGYRGPRFGYPTMPDQYTLDAFHRLELAPLTAHR